MSLVILFHFLCAQHVSDINISIIRSLRLFCWITTLVVLFWFDVCWSFSVVGLEWYLCCRLQNNTTNVVIQQNSRKLLMMDILMSETCWAHKKWNKIGSDIKLVFHSSTVRQLGNRKELFTFNLFTGRISGSGHTASQDSTALINRTERISKDAGVKSFFWTNTE